MIQIILSFVGPHEYMYMRINREWSKKYLNMYDDETVVHFESLEGVNYALEMGYRPSSYGILHTAVNESYDILSAVIKAYKASQNTSVIPPFIVALCADTRSCVEYMLENEACSVDWFFARARRFSNIDIYSEALATYISSMARVPEHILYSLLCLDENSFKKCFRKDMVNEDFIYELQSVNAELYKFVLDQMSSSSSSSSSVS